MFSTPYRYSMPIPQTLETKAYGEIVLYGSTNVYPQIVRQVINNCGIGKAATKLYSEFLIGDGFVDSSLNNIEINENGDTVLDLLRFIAESISDFNGTSLHFDYNTLMEITDINFLDFDYVRVGNPTMPSSHGKLFIWDNWAGEAISRGTQPVKFDRFNPRESDEQRYEKFNKFEDFKGEIMYYGSGCNNKRIYPLSVADPVLKDMMTWKSMAIFRQKSADNNFVASKIVEMLGTMESPEAGKLLELTLKNTLGAENAGNLMVVPGGYRDENGNLQSALKIHDVNITTYDSLFVNTSAQVENNILRTYNIPSLLLSVDNRNSLNTSTGALKEAYIIYNNFTDGKRKEITSLLNKFLYKHVSIPSDADFTIKPKSFINFE